MKPMLAAILVAAIAGASALAWSVVRRDPAGKPRRETAAAPSAAPRLEVPAPGPSIPAAPSDPGAGPERARRSARPGATDEARTQTSGAAASTDRDVVERSPRSRRRGAWPLRPPPGDPRAGDAGLRPAIPAELAFIALRFVGVDPGAEATWLQAINDPGAPPDLRSDLIEDLNQEGYSDNARPGLADLPLILARMELIERLAPLAMDDVNAAAFGEAYKDLLAMYLRLGGIPRGVH